MILTLFLLLLMQLIGEVVVFVFQLPLPGPVVGMALMLGLLCLKKGLSTTMEPTTSRLLKHLSLLFVPAGSGVILYLDLIAKEWLPIVISLILGTLLSIVFSAWLMALFDKSPKVLDHD